MEALRERFGKYHVLEKIAQGGMAEVYKVKTVGIAGFEKIQALKRILPHQAREARFIRSFIDEARIAVELTHRNIVQVFDFGKADGELFLAMELIEGKDLRTVMTQAISRDALPGVAIAAYVISEVASGLDYAHRKADGYGGSLGIVHCDVSPSNVMLSTEGDIKILDFGIARATFASALERRRLRGKPRYMAPEQTIGETPTAASDVFALGIIAWELFTGMALYRGSDLKAVLEAVRSTDPPRIDRVKPGVPAEIADAVATALSREPDQRGSAADLANACARAAMPAGPRQLARWLKDLESRPDRGPVPWHAEGTIAGAPDPAQVERFRPYAATSPALPSGAGERDSAPPSRPSATISLHDIPVPSSSPSLPRTEPGPGNHPSLPRTEPGPGNHRSLPRTEPGPGNHRSSPRAMPVTSTRAPEPPRSPAPPEPPAPPALDDDDEARTDRRSVRIERTEPIERVEAAAFLAPDNTERFERLDAGELDAGATHAMPSAAQAGRHDAGATHTMPSAAQAGRHDAGATHAMPSAAQAGRHDAGATHSMPSAAQAGRHDAGAMHPAPPRSESTATTTAQQTFDAARWSGRWPPEATITGHARLADALPPETMVDAAWPSAPPGTVSTPSPGETAPFVRRSYERLEIGPGMPPSALRFDDDVTHHGFALPPSAPEDTSYDELDVGPEPPAPPTGLHAAIGDAPIDDDLGEAAGGALAERRRIVLVAGMLSGAPPDQLRPVTKSLGELAYQRGGVVLELEPAALVVAFGLEIAGEDDVAIAMGWALDAAAMARDTADDGAAVQVRIGARAGVATAAPNALAPTVTVARPDGGPRIPTDAIDEARQLAREAAPDRPLFVGGAGRLTSSLYALRELPGRRVGRRSRVIEVIGPRSFDERDRARLERRGSFIGRDAQLAELDRWFQRAIAADRRLCVLITGAAGIGKSRLVAELVARRTGGATGASAPVRVITTASSPASRMAPFATVIDLYQAALDVPPARGRGARALVVHRLHQLMTRAGLTDERARTVTTDLDRAMELRDGLGVAREVADLRPRISAGLATFRTVMTSRERPALTIVEDVHLADSASLEVMRHTLAMPATGPELLVLTTRPEGPPPPAVDAVIELDDLTGPDLRALIADRLGDAASPLAIATVLARSGGNPLFVEELAQAVRDAGAAGEDVPASARDVVSARVDRLPVKAKTALRYASVLGGTVRARLLEELLGEDSLEHELDEVISAGFLVRPDGAAGGAEGELAFARGLVREVVYESLSARAQRDTHARVGRLLASRFFAGREEPPSAIAEHLERGGELAGAAAFWLRAGRLALSASDGDAAIACFTRTLAIERELGAAPPTAAAKARRREAVAGREEAHRLQGDLASDPGDLDELERLCDGEPARLADVAIRRAQRMMRLGDYARANDATVGAERHAIAVGDDRLRGEALRVRGEILERLGRFDDALAAVGAARDLFHRQRLVTEEMSAMVGRGRIHLLRAHYEAARDAYRPVLALIDKTGDPWLERIVSNHVAVIEMCLGNFAAAMQCARRSLELCRRYGDRGREGDALSVGAIVLLEVGLYEPAAAMFGDALDVLSRTNSRWSRADCLIYTGICEQRRGRPGGLRLLDEALDEARRLGARYLEANALVARAAVHLRTGALTAAIADAAAGTAAARDATLVGYEIQGLARHALALTRLADRRSPIAGGGDPAGTAGGAGGSAPRGIDQIAEAAALARRALDLLDTQRHLEGSVEEVIVACATVLRASGDLDRADLLIDRGRGSARRKLAALPDPTWRAAYAAVPEIAALLA